MSTPKHLHPLSKRRKGSRQEGRKRVRAERREWGGRQAERRSMLVGRQAGR